MRETRKFIVLTRAAALQPPSPHRYQKACPRTGSRKLCYRQTERTRSDVSFGICRNGRRGWRSVVMRESISGMLTMFAVPPGVLTVLPGYGRTTGT